MPFSGLPVPFHTLPLHVKFVHAIILQGLNCTRGVFFSTCTGALVSAKEAAQCQFARKQANLTRSEFNVVITCSL